MKRTIERLHKGLKRYEDMLDHAHTAKDIGLALRMIWLYRNALLSLEK